MASHMFHEWIVSFSNIKGVYHLFVFHHSIKGLRVTPFRGLGFMMMHNVWHKHGCFLNLLSAWVLLMSFVWFF